MSLRRPTGQAAFAGDLLLPGMLHLALRRSPIAHGHVRHVDAATARALPGVAVVLTSGDAPRLLPPELGYCGDRVALAAAEEPELARRAVEMVAIEIEPAPAVLDDLAAAADERQVAARLSEGYGDVAAGLASAQHVVAGEWRLPFTPALSLEPPQAITWLDEDRRLVVRTSAESPFRVRGALAERLDLPAAAIRVVRPLAAGGASGDGGIQTEDLCATITLRTGRPARLALTGDQQLTGNAGLPAQRVQLRLGIRDGRIVALELRTILDLGASADHADALLRSTARHLLDSYAFPNLRFEAVAVRTHRPPAGAARGADAGAALVLECAVDEAARALGEDPAAFRGRLLRRPGDPGAELLAKLGGRDDGKTPLLDVVSALPREARAPSRAPVPAIKPGSGLGLASRSPAPAAGAGPAASLRLLDDGSFTLSTGTPATGAADESAEVEAAAAILSVPAQRIVTAAADSDSPAFEAGEPFAAFLTPTFAIEEAARRAKERIREAGARLLGVPLAETTVERGRVRHVGASADAPHGGASADAQHDGGAEIGFAEIGRAALHAGEPLVATAAPAAAGRAPLAAARATVEVDTELGVVHLKQLCAAVAAGPFVDPRPHQALLEGALAMAVERALAAGLAFEPDGRPAIRALRDYPLAAPCDVPPLSVTMLPGGDGGQLGGPALAEVTTRAALAAIVNAVARATGLSLRSLPLSPPAVLDALDDAAARS